MKKILEVLQYGDLDVRFNTDIDVYKDPNSVTDTIITASTAMVTKLWGGNEISVPAMIRALAIADLAVSVNRKQMVEFLDEISADFARSMALAREEMEKKGEKIVTFPPGVKPPKSKS